MGQLYDIAKKQKEIKSAYAMPPSELAATPEIPARKPSFASSAAQAVVGGASALAKDMGSVAKGALKGAGSTIAGASALGEQLLSAPLKAVGVETGKPIGEAIRESGALTAEGTGEKLGFAAEQIAELFTPSPTKAAAAAKLAKFGKGWETVGRIIGSGVDYAAKRGVQKASYEDLPEDIVAGAAGEAVSVAGESVMKKLAAKFYKSALKPSTSIPKAKADEIVQTGLNERVLLTQNADKLVHAKIDALDDALESSIQAAEDAGKTVKTSEMKPFLEDAKTFFGKQADVKEGEKAIKEIDDLYRNFVGKYGEQLPPTVAQQLKRNTMTLVRKAYDKLTTASLEGQKNMAAGLRVGIEKATGNEAKALNEKMKKLIEFDEVLDKAVTRMSNSDLFSLKGAVIGGMAVGAGHPVAPIVSGLANVGASSGFKSAAGIVFNELGKISAKTGVPLQALFGQLSEYMNKNKADNQ